MKTYYNITEATITHYKKYASNHKKTTDAEQKALIEYIKTEDQIKNSTTDKRKGDDFTSEKERNTITNENFRTQTRLNNYQYKYDIWDKS